jgi:hypothetical protein
MLRGIGAIELRIAASRVLLAVNQDSKATIVGMRWNPDQALQRGRGQRDPRRQSKLDDRCGFRRIV